MLEIAARRPPSFPVSAWGRPLPPASRFVLHAETATRALAAAAWRVPFSEQACRAVVQGARATLWLGPDEYLLLAKGSESADALAGELERALQGAPHALVDVSHRQIAFEIHGPHAEAIVNGGCPLDLDAAHFPVDMCTRTLFGKADIVLWRTGIDIFHVETWRSFNDYMIALLAEIARDYT